jgi:hypothetical protein
LLILDLWGVSFHAVVVFGLGKNLLFKSVLGHCVHDEKNELLKEATITNFRQYGGRGGRDWPYHKDPALARNKEDISEAGDEIDTSAFGV